MTDTRLILHVKGTEAQTTELPREVVKAAISKGDITHSQLIWRPAENAWKPVREFPELLPSEVFILHVEGTESETRQMSGPALREAVAQGKVSPSQLVWRPAENAWKPLKEIPELMPKPAAAVSAPESKPAASVPVNVGAPSAAAAPVLMRVNTSAPPATPPVRMGAGTAAAAPVRASAPPAGNGVPQVRVAANPSDLVAPSKRPAAAPQVRATPVPKATQQVAPMAAQPQAAGPILVRTTGEMEVKHEEGMHFFKALFIGLAVLILAMVGANYFLVEKPLTTNLAQTRFASVPVYAHLGAFVQPNVVVIHLPDASAVRPDRLTRFLVDLAQSTPQNPLSHDLFGRVALTNGWTAQYSFSGYSWNQLGGMAKDSEDQRKEFIMDSLGDGAGQSLMPETTMSDKAQKAKRDKVWQTFVDHFSAQ